MTSSVLKNVTIGFGALIQRSNAAARVVILGSITVGFILHAPIPSVQGNRLLIVRTGINTVIHAAFLYPSSYGTPLFALLDPYAVIALLHIVSKRM